MPIVIAIAGGIGSGKSVVCRILMAMGYSVYDCDSRARAIMDSDIEIKRAIACRISHDALRADGSLDRKVISSVVFNDPSRLIALNEIVHGAVRHDLSLWIKDASSSPVFVETAILYQSGLDRMVDAVWEVTAPDDIRIERVCLRNGLTPEEVASRIASQQFCTDTPHPHVFEIINDGRHSLLLRIHQLLSSYARF